LQTIGKEREKMQKIIINTDAAPLAIGPYSQAVIGNGTLYVSGQLPIDPATGTIPDSIEEQVKNSINNMLTLVKEAGGTAENIVKCGLFIKDMSLFGKINEIYQGFFKENAPARFVVEVSQLPKGAQIEIDAVAAL
jgi:2-iminobutanoate/2-iminopropanoate deaminase